MQPDNCAAVNQIAPPYISFVEIRISARFAERRNERPVRFFGAGEFSTRYPVKFSAPAAGYHFHDLTGGEVNFVGIFSEGSGGRGRWESVCFFSFFFAVLNFSIAVRKTRARRSVPTVTYVRALYRGVSNPDALSLAAN